MGAFQYAYNLTMGAEGKEIDIGMSIHSPQNSNGGLHGMRAISLKLTPLFRLLFRKSANRL